MEKKILRFCEYMMKVNIYGVSFNSKTSFDVEYYCENEKIDDSILIECKILFNKYGLLMHNFGRYISKYILPQGLERLSLKYPFIIQTDDNNIKIVTDYIRSLDIVLNSLYKYYSKNKHILVEKPYEMVIVVKNLKEPKEIISQIVLDVL